MSNIIFLPSIEHKARSKRILKQESAKIYLFGGIRYEFIDEPNDGPQSIKPMKRKVKLKTRRRTK